jgi:hypothetical protein
MGTNINWSATSNQVLDAIMVQQVDELLILNDTEALNRVIVNSHPHKALIEDDQWMENHYRNLDKKGLLNH